MRDSHVLLEGPLEKMHSVYRGKLPAGQLSYLVQHKFSVSIKSTGIYCLYETAGQLTL